MGRILDITIALGGLLLTGPVLLVCWFILLIDTKQPIEEMD
jgi:lipopolysaccharide/colanic/teichoic acid biosynthesis glycosyltransferase